MQPYEPQPQYPTYGAHPDLPPEAPVPPAPVLPARRKHRVRIAVAGAAVLAAAGTATGFALTAGGSTTVAGSGTAIPSFDQRQINGTGPFGGTLPTPGSGNGGTGNGGTGNSSTVGTATAAQSVGVVDIVTVLGYQNAKAAGTGMVVTPSGEIVTNNHVVEGATSISVTIVSTGQTYTATVVGTDPTDDVAVIQLANASGLATANFGSSSTVAVGAAVTGVGNAGGTGGTPSASTGSVVALNQTVTASDASGQNSETVTGLIESDAAIQAGDSGGPLYDAAGKVVGMDTAAATGRGGATVAAYAIPITKALSIASTIESGQASSTIHIGATGFIGVSVSDTTGGAGIAGVVAGGPAAKAGIVAGDTITAVNGTAVSSGTTLHNLLSSTKPGQQVSVSWTDASGAAHHATVTLVAGPAD
ncbi:MAG: hypothetical protein QOG80_3495 [Pseudonocardiales bacterium]|jgi:S1-C subfamily serine protease|nr:hypothetical protein [Pseudonocardiales bacterium]